ncbi:AraC family transcriptional regulator [Mucilaginibacter sp. UR6-1]|uniref:AraC family transcriptional regulator n=1 Tax=Mucilaginibacter sp. UR6-1 TaxID=1435643 RepID=UPI001E60D977|nr:AraC family transcriptional regulator [Mucilaginibacter sp. UR6-1]MCC8410230.1 AraC family transcriptional regulator [Mucilaginibacter sp. UR6-1]
MNNIAFKRRDGFEGEKIISIPPKIWKDVFKKDPGFFQIYVAQIGYFPRASYHYRERRKGCEDNILIYCVQGKGYFVIDDKRIEVNANQYILVAATDKYMRYWADTETPWTIYWVHFNGINIPDFNRFLNVNNSKGAVTIPFNAKAIDLWNNMYDSLEMGYSTENLCNANFCLYNFIANFLFPERHIAVARDESTDVITLTINHMRANLDKKLSVDDMANQHKLSSSYFSILFRKATGMPPIDYFINLKMQKACQLLFSDEIRIKAVANSLGYEDQYYFSRLFKKFMGMSPEQYRSSARRDVIAVT